jgi:uncharacterized protein YkwD
MQNNRQQVVPVFFLIGMISACSSDLAVVKDPAQVAAPPSAAALEIDNAVIAEIFPKDGLSNDTCGLPDFSEQVIRQVNEIRSQARYCGTEYFEAAPSLVWQDAIRHAAYLHSVQMAHANVVSHTSFDSRQLKQRILATGYPYIRLGENITAGPRTVDVAMRKWLESPGHCKNLMDPNYTEVVAVCVAKQHSFYKTYWTMNLARPFPIKQIAEKKR